MDRRGHAYLFIFATTVRNYDSLLSTPCASFSKTFFQKDDLYSPIFERPVLSWPPLARGWEMVERETRESLETMGNIQRALCSIKACGVARNVTRRAKNKRPPIASKCLGHTCTRLRTPLLFSLLLVEDGGASSSSFVVQVSNEVDYEREPAPGESSIYDYSLWRERHVCVRARVRVCVLRNLSDNAC